MLVGDVPRDPTNASVASAEPGTLTVSNFRDAAKSNWDLLLWMFSLDAPLRCTLANEIPWRSGMVPGRVWAGGGGRVVVGFW